MKTIIALIVGISLISNSIIAGTDFKTSRIPFYIVNAASAYDIDAELMYALCQTESRCKANAQNKNDGTPEEKAAGIKVKSLGLFQIQVRTAEGLGFVSKTYEIVKKKRGKKIISIIKTIDHSKDLLDPMLNSMYAAKLLKKLYKKYHKSEKVISAYNAGHYVQSNKDYVYKVMSRYLELKLDKRQ